jgi:hypothetical protein
MLSIEVHIPHINNLNHEFIYALFYTTFPTTTKMPMLLAYQPSGIYRLHIDVPTSHVFKSLDAVVMQFAERPETHNLLTYAAALPIRKALRKEWFTVEFRDSAQPDAPRLAASCLCISAESWPITAGMNIEEFFLKCRMAYSNYEQMFERELNRLVMSREDLRTLLMTTFTFRLEALEVPNVTFFNISRDPAISPHMLNYLLSMACHYVGVSLLTFETACAKMLATDKSAQEIATNAPLMNTVVEAVNFACCIPSIMTPYSYDDFVDGKDGSVHHGERFTNMRVPARLLRNMDADCEEDGKHNAVVMYYMKHCVISAEQASQYPFLACANRLLASTMPASSLMLVKAANVAEANRSAVTDTVPVASDSTTGHMCALHLRNLDAAQVASGRKVLLVEDAKNGLSAVYFLEGTGNVRSNIQPFAPPMATVNQMLQARVRASPLSGFGQRLNMTRGEMRLHDPLFTPNNFYLCVDSVYPIHEHVRDGVVYVCCNSDNQRGANVADLASSNGGAYLYRMPQMDEETMALTETLMTFFCPEFELALTPLNPKVAMFVAEQNARMKRVDMDQTEYILSFMMNFHKITDDRWEDILLWIHAQEDIVFSDVECFGNIYDTPVVIIRLFFKAV